METAVLNQPFNSAQVELIQLLAHELESHELKALRKLLISFRFRLVEERAERIAQEKKWTTDDINALSQTHRRTTYKAKQKKIKNQTENGA